MQPTQTKHPSMRFTEQGIHLLSASNFDEGQTPIDEPEEIDALQSQFGESTNAVIRKLSQEITELRKSGHLKEALEKAQKAYLEHPESVFLQQAYGWVLYQLIKNTLQDLDASKYSERADLYKQLENYFRPLFHFSILRKPELLNSRLIALLSKIPQWGRFLSVARWFGTESFLKEDFNDREIEDNGKKRRVDSLYLRFHLAIAKSITGNLSYIKRENVEWALAVTSKALEQHRDHPWINQQLAIYHLNTQNPNQALAHLKPLMKRKSRDFWVWHLIGQLFQQLGKFEDAETCFSFAIQTCRKDSMSLSVRMDLVALLAFQNKPQEASAQLNQLISIRKREGYRLNDEIQALLNQPWYESNTLETKALNPKELEKKAFSLREKILQISTPEKKETKVTVSPEQTIQRASMATTCESHSVSAHHIVLISEAPMTTLGPLLDPSIQAKTVTLVASRFLIEKTKPLIATLQQHGIQAEALEIEDAFNQTAIEQSLLTLKNKYKNGASVNITGGSKPMSFVANEVFEDPKFKRYYVRFDDHLIWLDNQFKEHPISDTITLKNYIQAHGYKVTGQSSYSLPNEAIAWINILLNKPLHENLQNLLQNLQGVKADPLGRLKLAGPPSQDPQTQQLIELLLHAELMTKEADEMYIVHQQAFKLLQGGWLEQWTAFQLREIQRENPVLQDIELGIKITNPAHVFDDPNNPNNIQTLSNEMDVSALYNNSLLIVECKTGKEFRGETVLATLNKLATINRQIGGLKGQALLITLHPLSAHLKAQADLLNIQVFEGKESILGIKTSLQSMLR